MATHSVLYAATPVGGALMGSKDAGVHPRDAEGGNRVDRYGNPFGKKYTLTQKGYSWIPYIVSGPFYEGDFVLGLLGFFLHVAGWVVAFVADMIIHSKFTDGWDKILKDYWLVSLISLCIGLGLIVLLTLAAVCFGFCNYYEVNAVGSARGEKSGSKWTFSFGPKSVSPGMVGLMTGGVAVSSIFSYLILVKADSLYAASDMSADDPTVVDPNNWAQEGRAACSL